MREQEQKEHLIEGMEARRNAMKQKSKGEQVTHPYNNHVWLPLAHFINEQYSLDDIVIRQKNRQL